MNRYSLLLFAAILTGLTLPAVAGTFSYSSVSAEYSKYSSAIDGFSEDFEGNGKSLDISIALRPNLAVTAGYISTSADLYLSGTMADADITSTSIGLVGHLAINDSADFLLAISFFNGKADVDVDSTYFGTVDIDGGTSAIGIRKMLFDTLEVNGFIQRISVEDTSRVGMRFGAAYYVVKSVSVDFRYSLDTDSNRIAVALTKYF